MHITLQLYEIHIRQRSSMRMFVKCGTFPVCTNRGFYFIILHIFINRTLKVCAIHTSLPVPYISYFWQLLHHPPHPPPPPAPRLQYCQDPFFTESSTLWSSHVQPSPPPFRFIFFYHFFFFGGRGSPRLTGRHKCA